MAGEPLSALAEAVIKGDTKRAEALTQRYLNYGMDPITIVEDGLARGVRIVGEKFETGELFLPDLVMGAEAVCLGTAILTTKESSLSLEMKEKWMDTDIFDEDYHRGLYHLTLGPTRVPSSAIGFQKKVIPLKNFIETLMNEAEEILKSFGFTKEKFSTNL